MQISDGFGVNTPLPRKPYLPWDKLWWTRLFNSGFEWVRIGQYENSSDQTSWDWVEQKRGVYAVSNDVDDYIDSLVDNGVRIELQLLYGNPMYTGKVGRFPDSILPASPGAHPPDHGLFSIFWGPSTAEQRTAFLNYAKWMIKHFRGRIRHYSLWNEEDEYFWNESGNPEEYANLLREFIAAVRETDSEAKVVFGGLGNTKREFTRRVLELCRCASGIDVFAYHSYPGYGTNTNPEQMDSGEGSVIALRQRVRTFPGIRPDIVFWDDEYNSIPAWKGSDESVQTKYLPRALLHNLVAGVRTFIWQLISGTDGDQYDEFGLLHGMAYRPIDFTPRPVFQAVQNTNALFTDTKPDSSIQVYSPNADSLPREAPLVTIGFRSRSGKAIIAYWLAAHSEPGDRFPARTASLVVRNTGIERPILMDITSGKISALKWKPGSNDTLEDLPFCDSVMAIADEIYLDWPVLPEAPHSVIARIVDNTVQLNWETQSGDITGSLVERRSGERGVWRKIAVLPARQRHYTDNVETRRTLQSYRIRALNGAGSSAYSNIASARGGNI